MINDKIIQSRPGWTRTIKLLPYQGNVLTNYHGDNYIRKALACQGFILSPAGPY